jgi:hypothetical protein
VSVREISNALEVLLYLFEVAQEEFFALMTRKLGVPRTRFEFMGKDTNGDRIFEIR